MHSNIAAVVLMGGQNKRMLSQHKAFLTLGDQTFLEVITDKLSCFPDIYYSVDDIKKFSDLSLPFIEDCYSKIGPLGGIYSAFKSLPNYDYLFFIGCDTPFITSSYISYLLSQLTEPVDCLALCDDEGFIYPLGALYSKSLLPQIEKMIAEDNYRLQALVRNSNHKIIPLSQTPFDEMIFRNINTPEEYKQCLASFNVH